MRPSSSWSGRRRSARASTRSTASSLRHAAESQRPDGLTQMFAPGDHHTNGLLDSRLDVAVDPERRAALALHRRARRHRGDLPGDPTGAGVVRAADRPQRPGRRPALLALPRLGGARPSRRGRDAERRAGRRVARRGARWHARSNRRAPHGASTTLADRIATALNARHWEANAASTSTSSIRRRAARDRASRSTPTPR